jgi:hypothetical protein
MTLTDARLRSAKPKPIPYKLSDGGGLHLLVQLTGSRLWYRRYPGRLFDGRHLRAAREAAGLRQDELAAAAGLHTNSLRYWERQATEPCGLAVDRLLHALQEHRVCVAVDFDSHNNIAIAVIERRQ